MDDVDLSKEEVEDLFYRTATFYVLILKKVKASDSFNNKDVPYAINSIKQWMSAQLDYFKDRDDTKDRLGAMITSGTSNAYVPHWKT